jgi:uncharacterized protein YlxP (DUF503 family)
MVIGTLTARLLVRESRSLKDKRQVVRSILDKLRSNFPVAAAEVDHLDDHRQVSIGVVAIGPEREPVQKGLQSIQEALRGHPIAEYLGGEIALGHEVV